MTLIIIILIIGLVIYFYYQNQRLKTTGNRSASSGDNQTSSTTQVIFDNWENQTASVITSLEQEVSELTTERDEAIRSQKETEQELLALNNRLKNKSQEITNKEKALAQLKKEKSQVEIALNKTITELRTKYSKQGKLLDEQLETNNLSETIQQLEKQIQALATERKELINQERKLAELRSLISPISLSELTKKHWEKIKGILND